MKKKEMRFRMDFVQEIVATDDETRTLIVKLTPDPRRYEWKEINGERCLFDKFDHFLIPENVFAECAKKLTDRPLYFEPQLIGNADEYVQSRLPEIREEISGNFPEPTFEDKSEEFLESLKTDELGFVILSLDMVDSTSLQASLPPEKYSRLISVLLYEISSVVPLFHGHILKYTGDGIIAYFPEPSFITKNDLAIDCSLTLRKLVYNGINPIIRSLGYNQIDIRIGLDSGNAFVVTIGNPETKQHKDIIGLVVSLASKIQATANLGSINLGQATVQNLHTGWRMICSQVDLPKGWKYKTSDGVPYQIYKVDTR